MGSSVDQNVKRNEKCELAHDSRSFESDSFSSLTKILTKALLAIILSHFRIYRAGEASLCLSVQKHHGDSFADSFLF